MFKTYVQGMVLCYVIGCAYKDCGNGNFSNFYNDTAIKFRK